MAGDGAGRPLFGVACQRFRERARFCILFRTDREPQSPSGGGWKWRLPRSSARRSGPRLLFGGALIPIFGYTISVPLQAGQVP